MFSTHDLNQGNWLGFILKTTSFSIWLNLRNIFPRSLLSLSAAFPPAFILIFLNRNEIIRTYHLTCYHRKRTSGRSESIFACCLSCPTLWIQQTQNKYLDCILLFKGFVFICVFVVCLPVNVCCAWGCPRRTEEGIWFTGARITGVCPLCDMGAGNQAWVLWNSSKCCKSLCLLSSPDHIPK